MEHKFAYAISILAVILPICSIVISLFLEPEIVEAIFGGLIIGCIIGSVLGAVSMGISKGKSVFINTLSILPMIPLVLYLLLLLP